MTNPTDEGRVIDLDQKRAEMRAEWSLKVALETLQSLHPDDYRTLQEDVLARDPNRRPIPTEFLEDFHEWLSEYGVSAESMMAPENQPETERQFYEYVIDESDDYRSVKLARFMLQGGTLSAVRAADGEAPLPASAMALAELLGKNAVSDADRVRYFKDLHHAGIRLTRAPDEALKRSEGFHEWFDKSKGVDSSGEPLVFFHGTRPNGDIHEFSFSQHDGCYFSPDVAYAEAFTSDLFGKNEGSTGAIYPVYLSLQNPYVVRACDTSPEWEEFVSRGLDLQKLKDQGYDSTMLFDETGQLDQVCTFHPSQIKSAICAVRFDRTNAYISDRSPQQVEHEIAQICGSICGSMRMHSAQALYDYSMQHHGSFEQAVEFFSGELALKWKCSTEMARHWVDSAVTDCLNPFAALDEALGPDWVPPHQRVVPQPDTSPHLRAHEHDGPTSAPAPSPDVGDQSCSR